MNQEVAVHCTACPPQGSCAWQLANLEEEGAGRRQLGGSLFHTPTFTFCLWPPRESKAGGSRLFTNPTAHFPSTRELCTCELLSKKSNDSTFHTQNKHHDGAERHPQESVSIPYPWTPLWQGWDWI